MEQKTVATIKNRIEEGLIIRNLKPIDLANRTGIPKASISHYLKGKVNPKQDRIYLISKALNCNPAWIMGYDVPFEKEEQDFSEESAHLVNVMRKNKGLQNLIKLEKEMQTKIDWDILSDLAKLSTENQIVIKGMIDALSKKENNDEM